MAAGIVAGGEACFQLVAEGHQFIDFGDDTVLFGEGRETYDQIQQDRLVQILHSCADR